MASRRDLEGIAALRAHGLAQAWSIPRIVEAIVGRFGVSRLKAHRLARELDRLSPGRPLNQYRGAAEA
ncbi:MAG: hypothetical protein ACRDYA_19025 [Egibacteraceae bacterium]